MMSYNTPYTAAVSLCEYHIENYYNIVEIVEDSAANIFVELVFIEIICTASVVLNTFKFLLVDFLVYGQDRP